MENQAVEQKALFNEQFDALLTKLQEAKYQNQGYSVDSRVNISGELFGDFLNFVASTKSMLESVEKANQVIERMATFVLEEGSKMTVRLMEAHITNIEEGNTVSHEVLDEKDAEVKIQEIKE